MDVVGLTLKPNGLTFQPVSPQPAICREERGVPQGSVYPTDEWKVQHRSLMVVRAGTERTKAAGIQHSPSSAGRLKAETRRCLPSRNPPAKVVFMATQLPNVSYPVSLIHADKEASAFRPKNKDVGGKLKTRGGASFSRRELRSPTLTFTALFNSPLMFLHQI